MRNLDRISREVKIEMKFRDEGVRFLKISSYLDRRREEIRYISLLR